MNSANEATGVQHTERNLQVLQKEDDTLTTSSFSSVSVSSARMEAGLIQELLQECRELHWERMKKLEADSSRTPEEQLQMKMTFLHSYVDDLTEQNQMLAEIVEVSRRGVGRKPSAQKSSNVDLRTQLMGDPRSSVSLLQALMEPYLDNCCESNNVDVSDLEEHLAQSAQNPQTVAIGGEILTRLHGELSCLQKIQEDNMKERAEKDVCITKLQATVEALQQEQADAHAQLQASERKLDDVSQTLDETRADLHTDRRQRQEIQDQLQAARKEVERLQRELTDVRRSAGKKIQRRESKLCALLKELTGFREQNAEYEKEMLRKEKSASDLGEEIDDLRVRMEEQGRECVLLSQTKERLEADLALSHEHIHNSHLEVLSRDQYILQLRAEMTTAEQKRRDAQKKVRHLGHELTGHQNEVFLLTEKVRDLEHLKEQKEKDQQEELRISQQQVQMFKDELEKQDIEIEVLRQELKGTKDERNKTRLQTQEQEETAALFKRKYTAAVERMQRVQEQVELLQEELQYSQEQLKKSQSTAHSAKEEVKDLERRYREKADQWESSQELLDRLTEDLQANQLLLRESRQEVDHVKSLTGSLQEQVDTLKQQRQMVEHDLQLYKQSHTYSNEEYFSLLSLRQQLQKNCTDQAERLAECEKVTLKMKSELQRHTQEKADLKQRLSASHHAHHSRSAQLEREVACLKAAVASLKLELADSQTVEVTRLRQSEEKVKEARQEAARRQKEVDSQRKEVQRLQGELQNQEENVKITIREIQGLNARTEQLNLQLEDQRREHQAAMEELAARAEKEQRMERRLKEGELAEEKIRLMAVRLEKKVAELRRDLSLAVDQKLEAEREKQDAQRQMITVKSELEATRSDKAKLQHESNMVMENVNLWIKEQKASNERLAAQLKAQNEVLLVNTADKQILQEANDTLKTEVKTLKRMVDEKERRMQRFKAQIQDCSFREDGNKNAEMKGCVARRLGKIEDVQTKLRSHLEAIRKLNQQLDVLSRENKGLRRQLEEEKSMRRQAERLASPPPISQPCTSTHLLHPTSTSIPTSLSTDVLTGLTDGSVTQSQLRAGVAQGPVDSQALSELFCIRPPAARDADICSWRTCRHLAKYSPPEDFDLS